MTTPDHRPYLLATDLRTADDALAWLESRALTSPAETVPVFSSFWVLSDACDALRARLDRERRQACRRGALDRWRAFSIDSREYARQKRDEGLICDSEAEYYIERHLSDALAFRAAARLP